MEKAFFWYLNLISFTHSSVVAEKRRHCIFLLFELPAPLRMTSTSSANPMISFVQDNNVALTQIEVATFKVVHDASRISNNDVNSLVKIACLEPGGI